MLIIGTRYFCWKVGYTDAPWHCGNCGSMATFDVKKGMRFMTLFFIVPVLPISGLKHMIECPRCKTRFQPKADLVVA
jgi:hypothetical protein